jgi:hypothetical protein
LAHACVSTSTRNAASTRGYRDQLRQAGKYDIVKDQTRVQRRLVEIKKQAKQAESWVEVEVGRNRNKLKFAALCYTSRRRRDI